MVEERKVALIVQPSLLKKKVLRHQTKVFVCGPGYTSGGIEVRSLAREALDSVKNVKTIYGEEIEKEYSYRNLGIDLQTLESNFAHDVDFTLLILESPGSIAELGTFVQIKSIRDRLIVLVPGRFYKAESYIARGPLSLLANYNPNSVIYFDAHNKDEMKLRVNYPLTFFKYANYIGGIEYIRNSMLRFSKNNVTNYSNYIAPVRDKYNQAVVLISIIVGERPSYADLLLFSGLAPRQLNAALHSLYQLNKIQKIGSGRYLSENGYEDELLEPFSSTELSKLRARLIARA